MPKLSQKSIDFAKTAINAAKLSIEMFNRVEPIHWKESVLILNAQSWELLLKAVLLKRKQSIYESDGKTISADKALNKVLYNLKAISNNDARTVGQILSLRHEAMHSLLPSIDDEILTHLIYFSVTGFNELVKKEFKSLKSQFEKNYLSVALKNHTFYSNKVEKLFKYSRQKNSEQNRLLFLLDRGCEFVTKSTNLEMKTKDKWDQAIKKLSKKSRVMRHLAIYDYINNQDNVRIVPVHIGRGYSAAINIHPSKNPSAPFIVKKTDPNKDFPHFTSDVARIVGKNSSFIAKMSKDLNIKNNEEYCYLHKLKRGENPKYSDKGLNFIKNYLEKNPNYWPY